MRTEIQIRNHLIVEPIDNLNAQKRKNKTQKRYPQKGTL